MLLEGDAPPAAEALPAGEAEEPFRDVPFKSCGRLVTDGGDFGTAVVEPVFPLAG